jgi:hypothetical protein
MPLDVKTPSSFAFAAGFESASSRDMQRLIGVREGFVHDPVAGAHSQVGDARRSNGDPTVPPQENFQ